jgi:hypothetical protein
VLHDQVLDVVVHPDVVERADMRMIQAGVASTDGVNFDRQPTPEERAALLAYLRKL